MNERQADILAHEERLTNASRALDVDALDRLYADDIMMTGVLGQTCDKQALIDEARRGVAQRLQATALGKDFVSMYAKEGLKVVFHGDTAVTSYRFVVTFTDGIDVRRTYRTTNVWAKRGTAWQIVAAHTAFVLDAQQAAMLAGEARS
jgi:ketosteroid isomerase-like protein